jgi:ABC-type branched-subunit amino acid transport system substrate-binding protein
MRSRIIAATLVAACGLGALVPASGIAGGHAAASTVNVGIVAPQGTPFFNMDNEIAAVRAGVRTVNATGGFNGHKVKLIYCNDKGDPNTLAACGRQMVDSKVVALFGGARLNGGTVLTPILEKAGIPQIGIVAIQAQEFSSPITYLFGSGPNVTYSVETALVAAHRVPTSLVYIDQPSATPLLAILKDILAKKGQSFTAQVPVAATQADFAPIVQKASGNGAKATIVFLGAEQAQAYIAAAARAGFKGTFINAYAWNKSDINKLGGGNVLSQLFTSFQLLPASASTNPLVREYVKSIKAERATGDTDAGVGLSGGQSDVLSGGWLGLWAVQQIAKRQKLKTITAQTLRAALKRTKNLDMRGVSPAWTPDKPGPKGYERNAGNDRFFFFDYKKNRLNQLNAKPLNVTDILAGKASKIRLP